MKSGFDMKRRMQATGMKLEEVVLEQIAHDQVRYDKRHGMHRRNISEMLEAIPTRRQAEKILEILKIEYPKTIRWRQDGHLVPAPCDVVNNWKEGIEHLAEQYANNRDPESMYYRPYAVENGLIPEGW